METICLLQHVWMKLTKLNEAFMSFVCRVIVVVSMYTTYTYISIKS